MSASLLFECSPQSADHAGQALHGAAGVLDCGGRAQVGACQRLRGGGDLPAQGLGVRVGLAGSAIERAQALRVGEVPRYLRG
jgi:hypothetical protein